MAHGIKNFLFVVGRVDGGRGKGTREVIHLFKTVCGEGEGGRDGEDDSLISNCIEKSSQ